MCAMPFYKRTANSVHARLCMSSQLFQQLAKTVTYCYFSFMGVFYILFETFHHAPFCVLEKMESKPETEKKKNQTGKTSTISGRLGNYGLF